MPSVWIDDLELYYDDHAFWRELLRQIHDNNLHNPQATPCTTSIRK